MPSLDRRAVVARHAVEVRGIDTGAALSVGNGELCMTVDITGLQTFPERYPVADPDGGVPGTLLGTQAQWGWHSLPRPGGTDEEDRWLLENPHRLDLARIGLVLLEGSGHRPPEPSELGASRQVLDLWTGVITSELMLARLPIKVTTACHPDQDTIAIRIESPPGTVGVRVAFPYGSTSWSNAADWSRPHDHETELDGALVRRRFDGEADPTYQLRVRGTPIRRTGRHELTATATGAVLELAVSLATGEPSDVDCAQVFAASRAHWPRFWESGAAIDFTDSTDPRAPALERRAVLSQYLTAIQCAGSLPPQETGLTCNSWRGRFHLEMHWWHAAHFALWGRPELLRRSMDFYRRIVPIARKTAAAQGYRGARWPKQVGPEGRETPSHIGPFLLWQQPHVIHLAELLRRAGDDADYGELVEDTAQFMADIAEPTPDGFALGPPLIPAQESYAAIRDRVRNPPFELAYWAWALGVAKVHKGMARPLIRNGRYAAIAVEPFTVREDHPSMVYALGFVPETGVVEPEVVRATLHDVLADWDWESTWGWDYPALAMTATRLHEPETAIAALLRDSPKNVFLRNGHNRQTDSLPVYLPGNGGLLAALALMVAGWDGGPSCPGFPRDGTWVVRHEGFVRSP